MRAAPVADIDPGLNQFLRDLSHEAARGEEVNTGDIHRSPLPATAENLKLLEGQASRACGAPAGWFVVKGGAWVCGGRPPPAPEKFDANERENFQARLSPVDDGYPCPGSYPSFKVKMLFGRDLMGVPRRVTDEL